MIAAAKYDAAVFDATWANVLARVGSVANPKTLGTVVRYAREGGMPGRSEGQTTKSTLPRLSLHEGVIGFTDEPPAPRDYVLDHLLTAGKSALLAGFGGVSKTQWLIQASICIALGIPFMGQATGAGSVLLLLGEEDKAEIDRRFNAVAKLMDLTPEQVAIVARRVRAFPMVGLDMRLTRILGGSLEATEFTSEIIEAAGQLSDEAELPCRLIGLDHAGLIHGGEFNSREDVVQTMRQVNRIGSETGAAVVVLAHSPKAATNKDKASSSDVAGSSAWVDLARGAMVLRTMSDEDGKRYGIAPDNRRNFAALHVVKNNLGPSGDQFWFMRSTLAAYGVGALQHFEMQEPEKAPKGIHAVEARLLDFIRQHPGQYTKTGLRDSHSGVDGPFKASKRDLAAALETLIADGRIVARKPTDDERSKFGLHHSVGAVLEAKL